MPPRRGSGNLNQQRAEATASARELLTMGRSPAQAKQSLGRRFPNLPASVRGAAVANAAAGLASGEYVRSLDPNDFVYDQRISTNPDLPDAYQYVVAVTYQPSAGGPPQTRQIVIDSDLSLTQGEIEDAAREQAIDMADQGELGSPPGGIDEEQDIETYIVSAAR